MCCKKCMICGYSEHQCDDTQTGRKIDIGMRELFVFIGAISDCQLNRRSKPSNALLGI